MLKKVTSLIFASTLLISGAASATVVQPDGTYDKTPPEISQVQKSEAHTKPEHKKHRANHAERMKVHLGLTDEQSQSMDALFIKFNIQAKENALQFKSELEALLTPEQLEKFNSMKKKKRDRGRVKPKQHSENK
jgi:Spy/CpxP family protein refolding chaperone